MAKLTSLMINTQWFTISSKQLEVTKKKKKKVTTMNNLTHENDA